MTDNINQQLIKNISSILKMSLSADATLMDLRVRKETGFSTIFSKDAGFSCSANTFQPYVQELADNLLLWQQNQEQTSLVKVVKQIEKLFTVLGSFEKSHTEPQ
jgi:primosomal protein N''